MKEEEIDLSLSLDPSDGKIPEEGFSNYARSGTFLSEEYMDLWKDFDPDTPCSVCGKDDPSMSRYMERSPTGDAYVYCQECFYEESRWAKIDKPRIEARSKKAKRCFIFTMIFVIFIIIRALMALLEVLVK